VRACRPAAPRLILRAASGAIALAVATPAGAVVGGTDDAGSLARASVMVLSSKGGVCTGVVVARDVILTAGHCAAGAEKYRVHWKANDGAPVLVTPTARAVHPGYDTGAVAGRRRSIDLALILLPQPLPLRFETAALSAARVAPGAPLTLGGFGVASLGEGRSAGTFRTAALAAIEPHGPSRILVWARGARGVGACHGDSGGPIARAGSSEVLAITTWAAGTERAGCGGISQGVLIGPQRIWIDRTLAAWGRQARWP
jgi:hypothetical protein